MKAYLAIKFKENGSNRELIERLSKSLKQSGIIATVFYRDYEQWGTVTHEPQELMTLALRAIKEQDILIVEFTEKGVGLGIEAGYALAMGKSVHVIAKSGSEISETLKGIAQSVTFYDAPEHLDTSSILST